MIPSWVLPLLSLIIGLLSGWGGSILGSKISIARLEEWKTFVDGRFRDVDGKFRSVNADIAILKDDSATFDMEIGDMYRRDGIDRVVRQSVRR